MATRRKPRKKPDPPIVFKVDPKGAKVIQGMAVVYKLERGRYLIDFRVNGKIIEAEIDDEGE